MSGKLSRAPDWTLFRIDKRAHMCDRVQGHKVMVLPR